MAVFFFLFLLFVSFVSPAVSQTSLTLADRIQAQEKIEKVYYNHRIWPETNKSLKPPFEEMVPHNVIEKKVNDLLSVRISAAMLQSEMDRIAKTTKDPEMLQELFSALNNDPYLIAETLVRPILAERMIHKNKFVPAKKMKKFSFILPEINSGSSCEAWEVLDAPNPPSPRSGHTAIWTGTEMIVWGGSADSTGGRYNPALNTWTPTSIDANVPSPRFRHTAVWTGTEMIIWGGIDSGGLTNTGGRYNPATDSWITTSVGINVPEARSLHTAVWTGSEMIIWGGGDIEVFELNTGGRYDPSTDSWQPTSIGMFAPEARLSHSAIWTGQEMIIWGGAYGAEFPLKSGGRYNPISDSWLPTTLLNVPEGRRDHTAIWTGSQMIIWGGIEGVGAGGTTDTGAMYDPVANQWQATPTGNAPFERTDHTAIWTGEEMIVWGGWGDIHGFISRTKTGGRYSFANDIWLQATVETNTPSARYRHTAIWTGSKMIVFGGQSNSEPQNTGAIFTPKPANIVLTPIGFDLPNAEYNVPYLQNISAITTSPSNSPSTMALVEGDLPLGLTFDGSSGMGVISGIPTYEGIPFPFFTITATDADSCSGSRTYYIYLCPTMTFYPYPLSDGKVGIPYNQKINVTINDPKFSVTSGTLPDGLIMDGTGLITGVPTIAGTFNFVVTATGYKCSKSHDYFINIMAILK